MMCYIFCCYELLLDLHVHHPILYFFFFNDTATTEIYTLSLHDALPISVPNRKWYASQRGTTPSSNEVVLFHALDRKSTRLNSSHGYISYAVFCLKKKKTTILTAIMHSSSHTTRTPLITSLHQCYSVMTL